MRLALLILALASLRNVVRAELVDDELVSTEPEILVTASFPEDNPFGQVVNGERNRINLVVENNSELNVTLVAISGSFHDVESNALVKNAPTVPYGMPLLQGTKLQLPYLFHSEFKPGDIRLNIWLVHTAEGQTYNVSAYDSVITVVEPEVSIFDYRVVSTYLITIAFLGGLGYLAFNTFFPKSKKARKPVTSKGGKSAISSPLEVSASGAVDDEWIPAHHLKNRSVKGKGKEGTLTSGDELSGGETSGAEAKRRKGRK
ncbi:hypothetical protein SCHPADRAFT_858651 [Schizopora paradoxa]|uniref:Translocon-associated protein subunit alpha n=1 Tax=Schizopora paradoxa TaxID=27342 RepID=A0A0H2RAC2_9AGAM|nr:hypothetical protein SCHPADRAFT_858651 [Schizopora paradoxa]